MRLRWYRFTVVIVGRESGNRSPLPFVRFRHLHEAEDWCNQMNESHTGYGPDGSTYFEAVEI